MNVIKDNIELLQGLEDLKGKRIIDVWDFSVGENVEAMFVTEDKCLLHIAIQNDYGDMDFRNVDYETLYYNVYRYGEDDYTKFLEKHNLINLDYVNRLKEEGRLQPYSA